MCRSYYTHIILILEHRSWVHPERERARCSQRLLSSLAELVASPGQAGHPLQPSNHSHLQLLFHMNKLRLWKGLQAVPHLVSCRSGLQSQAPPTPSTISHTNTAPTLPYMMYFLSVLSRCTHTFPCTSSGRDGSTWNWHNWEAVIDTAVLGDSNEFGEPSYNRLADFSFPGNGGRIFWGSGPECVHFLQTPASADRARPLLRLLLLPLPGLWTAPSLVVPPCW